MEALLHTVAHYVVALRIEVIAMIRGGAVEAVVGIARRMSAIRTALSLIGIEGSIGVLLVR